MIEMELRVKTNDLYVYSSKSNESRYFLYKNFTSQNSINIERSEVSEDQYRYGGLLENYNIEVQDKRALDFIQNDTYKMAFCATFHADIAKIKISPDNRFVWVMERVGQTCT